ncbi:hypothetical protein AMECASPLE_014349 [Ameca splendens]|uniref:Uncharacterized protein n=1 Tax=Ameca splendens TaxID=208324 RepID=A0ABV1A8P7_9TELE
MDVPMPPSFVGTQRTEVPIGVSLLPGRAFCPPVLPSLSPDTSLCPLHHTTTHVGPWGTGASLSVVWCWLFSSLGITKISLDLGPWLRCPVRRLGGSPGSGEGSWLGSVQC